MKHHRVPNRRITRNQAVFRTLNCGVAISLAKNWPVLSAHRREEIRAENGFKQTGPIAARNLPKFFMNNVCDLAGGVFVACSRS
jgi:hypothetical protein